VLDDFTSVIKSPVSGSDNKVFQKYDFDDKVSSRLRMPKFSVFGPAK